jgi:hypothetical protein
MPLECHPQVELLERRALEWMNRNGFCPTPAWRDRVAGTKTALFFAQLCPWSDVNRLQIAVDWGYLMFVFDDVVCDQESTRSTAAFLDLAVRIIRTLESPAAAVLDPAHPFTPPIRDLAERIHRTATPTQIKRLVDGHRAWFMGVAWDMGAREQGMTVRPDDYIFTRMLHSAVFPTLAWFQLVDKETVPAHEIDAPEVVALTEMAGMAAAIDDDLYSHGRERWFEQTNGEQPFTGDLIAVYMTEKGCSYEEALQEAAELRNRFVARFTKLRDEVLPTASAPLSRYLANLTCLLRGNFEWGLVADRYTNPDGRHPGSVRTIGTVTDTPPADSEVPELSSIRWWWDVAPVSCR